MAASEDGLPPVQNERHSRQEEFRGRGEEGLLMVRVLSTQLHTDARPFLGRAAESGGACMSLASLWNMLLHPQPGTFDPNPPSDMRGACAYTRVVVSVAINTVDVRTTIYLGCPTPTARSPHTPTHTHPLRQNPLVGYIWQSGIFRPSATKSDFLLWSHVCVNVVIMQDPSLSRLNPPPPTVG